MFSRNRFRQRRGLIFMIFFLAQIAEKEDAAENRINKLKEAKENENRLSKEVKQKRHKNAKIKKYFEDYQTGLRRSLTAKKTQGEFQYNNL